ncbi:hypothetical protein ABZ478_13650 [Streptomyces sp. NPDC005706]|uniref:hypothetical protein n=1 Tax=Streptomyces sp. NPDC005706 TaxID=3157169 RepID=UPI00340300E2
MEDVLGTEAEEAADLRRLQELVVASDVLAMGLSGAVVRVALDLHRQPFPAEEEVHVAASAVRGAYLRLAFGAESGVVHA